MSVINDILMHYGMPRRSGRYPWGSGDNPYQRTGDFLSRVDELKKKGLSEKDIADSFGLTTSKLRVQLSMAKAERRSDLVARAKSMREHGYSLDKIAKEMGYENDSSVRSLLNADSEAKMNQARATADILKKMIDEKGMIDVGAGSEQQLGVSREKLNEALYMLEMEGYPTYGGRVPQITNPGQHTTIKAVCPPGTEHKEIYNYENIHPVEDFVSYDGGESFKPSFIYPANMDSKRLQIRYGDEGGADKDGVIELRRGVPDISLGNSHYAQVRILVDNDRYLKGMAMYSDNLPDGVDVLFNTNKKSGTDMRDVLKEIKKDPENPFGSLIKEHGGQSFYDDPNGKYVDALTGKKQSLSLINKRSDEGDWGEWSNKLSSQFLGKQSMELINRQLGLSKKDARDELDVIESLTNPTLKKVLLNSYAEDCDAAAVHLKAAALPRQSYQVILPLTSISEKEVYAPNYHDGETVALVRYPHGGTFEIPVLKVNNKQDEGKRVLGTNPKDAIGISSKVAERLSGADFDGDTVMVIPCNSSKSSVKITSTEPLEGLKNFDPKMKYGGKPEGTFKVLGKNQTQKEMGVISNLITDMTLQDADTKELAAAVRHSMVVIDANKHKLDYKQSEADNNIAALKAKYQGHIGEDGRYHEGAATLLSKSKSTVQVQKRKGSPIVNEDGSVTYKEANETYYDTKTGKVKTRMQNSTKMAETKDARTLSTGTKQEEAYADYANYMKGLANEARREAAHTGKIAYNASAKATYSQEVSDLNTKVRAYESNKPRERQAQLIANAEINAKKKADPELANNKKELKKAKQQALAKARVKTGAKRTPIDITDKEWEAIQAGAITENVLYKILDGADTDALKQRAMPRTRSTLSQTKLNKISAMSSSGYTNREIADALGISISTVSKYINN